MFNNKVIWMIWYHNITQQKPETRNTLISSAWPYCWMIKSKGYIVTSWLTFKSIIGWFHRMIKSKGYIVTYDWLESIIGWFHRFSQVLQMWNHYQFQLIWGMKKMVNSCWKWSTLAATTCGNLLCWICVLPPRATAIIVNLNWFSISPLKQYIGTLYLNWQVMKWSEYITSSSIWWYHTRKMTNNKLSSVISWFLSRDVWWRKLNQFMSKKLPTMKKSFAQNPCFP